MYFSVWLITILVNGVYAVEFTNPLPNYTSIQAGRPFDIEWGDADGPVDIQLVDGSSHRTIEIIGSGLTGSSYTWTPGGEYAQVLGTYSFYIVDGPSKDFSPEFSFNKIDLTRVPSTTSQQKTSSSSSTSPPAETTTSEIPIASSTFSADPEPGGENSLSSTSPEAQTTPTEAISRSSPSPVAETTPKETASESLTSSTTLPSNAPTGSSPPTTSLGPSPSSLTGTSSISPSSTPQQEASTPTAGLSTGAKVGIGIGAALGSLAIICLVFLVLYYRKRAAKEVNGNSVLEKAELGPGTMEVKEGETQELADTGISEAPNGGMMMGYEIMIAAERGRRKKVRPVEIG